jgi:hypothetical protein
MFLSAPAIRRLRLAGIVVGGGAAVFLLAAVLLLGFGWGLLRPLAERRLAAAHDRPVRIGAIGRAGGGLFQPVLAIRDVTVGQPAWAGRGAMVELARAEVSLPVLPLLVGRVRPRLTRIDGLRAHLLRLADGRANWEGRKRGEGDGGPDLGAVAIADAVVDLDDRRHQHRFALALRSDARGFRVNGPGQIAGVPATLALSGPAVGGNGPWPFQARITSPLVSLDARGTMAKPLDVGHFTAQLRSEGHDLTDLDHIIQAGLPASQPFRLTATIIHDKPAWIVRGLAGTLGRSDLRAELEVRKRPDDRTLLKGRFFSNGFDFDDLASDAQLAQAAAAARRTGPRVVPSTRIDLSKLRALDGVVQVDIRRLLSRKPSIFRTLSGTLTLDHGVLTAAPLRSQLAAGTLAGSAVVRHQAGRPLLLLDLRLRGGRLERLFRTNGIVDGPLDAHIKLSGHGETVRDAVAQGQGRIGVAGLNGSLTRRVALLLGADVGRGLFAGNSERTGLRCLVADFALSHGVARAGPLVIDTDVARADGQGQVRLADERILIHLTGSPKKNSALRLNGPITVAGTLSQPTINPPPQTKTVGGLLKMVGKALGGDRQPLGQDADCRGLAARALR